MCKIGRMSPRVSIVMPCYQQATFVEEAVRSVLDQRGVDVELLVMDPGSTDGSREIVVRLSREYGERLRMQFEPDNGQSDAINKGLSLARGTVLTWLNSDDRLRPGALERVVSALHMEEPAWLYGRAGVIDELGRPTSGLMVQYKNWRGKRFSRFKLLTENFIPQMAVFWNRALWQQSGGGLDLAKDLDMDYDLWHRFARISEPTVLREELADFRVHHAAKGSRSTGEQLDAAYATARRYAPDLGLAGRMALVLHRIFGLRTRIVYRWMKP